VPAETLAGEVVAQSAARRLVFAGGFMVAVFVGTNILDVKQDLF
jgi:hypothetical protein